MWIQKKLICLFLLIFWPQRPSTAAELSPNTFTQTWDSSPEADLAESTLRVTVFPEKESTNQTEQPPGEASPAADHQTTKKKALAFRVALPAALLAVILLGVTHAWHVLVPKPAAQKKLAKAEEPVVATLPSEAVQDAGSISHALWRMGNIKDLLYVASSLASSLATEEAHALLQIIQKSVAIAEEPEGTRDNRALLVGIENSLEAMHKLHQAAIESVAELADSFETVAASPLLEKKDSFYGLAVTKAEKNILFSIESSLESIRDSEERMAREFRKAYVRFCTGGVFRNEKDKAKLIAAAGDLSYLLTLKASKDSAAHSAKAMEAQRLAAAKILVMGKRMKFSEKAGLRAKFAEARLRLASNRILRNPETKEQREHEDSLALTLKIERALTSAQSLLTAFREVTKNIEDSETLEDVLKIDDDDSKKHQGEIQDLLDLCWALNSDLRLEGDRLEAVDAEAMLMVAREAQKEAERKMEKVRGLRDAVEERVVEEASSSVSGRTAFSGVFMATEEATELGEECLTDSAKALKTVANTKSLLDLCYNFQKLALNAPGIVQAETSINMQQLSLNFLKVLQDDVANVASYAVASASHASQACPSTKAQIQEILKEFYSAYRNAVRAKTVQAAATAANNMRALVEEIQRSSEMMRETRF